MKNNFGCVTGLNKAKMHLRAQDPETFSQMLVDLLGIVRPELTVMDAVVGMEGNGPSNGSPKKLMQFSQVKTQSHLMQWHARWLA